jgi:hypothetical protein
LHTTQSPPRAGTYRSGRSKNFGFKSYVLISSACLSWGGEKTYRGVKKIAFSFCCPE